MRNFLLGRLKGCIYAAKGVYLLIKNEPSIQVQIIATIGVTIAGFVFNITNYEWMIQIFAIGLVLTAEGLNTAIEEIANFVHPNFHDKIGYIKDVAAGAVFFAAIIAVIIACIIYFPKF